MQACPIYRYYPGISLGGLTEEVDSSHDSSDLYFVGAQFES
jgi:hypothetical protein